MGFQPRNSLPEPKTEAEKRQANDETVIACSANFIIRYIESLRALPSLTEIAHAIAEELTSGEINASHVDGQTLETYRMMHPELSEDDGRFIDKAIIHKRAFSNLERVAGLTVRHTTVEDTSADVLAQLIMAQCSPLDLEILGIDEDTLAAGGLPEDKYLNDIGRRSAVADEN